MLKKGFSQWLAMILCMALLIGVTSYFTPAPVDAASFAKGADISWVPGMEEQGYVWYDKNGNKRDVLDILKNDYNINSVRIRTWVNPTNDYANGYLNKERSIALAKRAKDMGFQICFNFHYSDSWADPGKQYKPSAWSRLNFEQLMKQTYDYTYDVMSDLAKEGIYPEWVQVGNETNNGMLWEDGKASENMRNFAWLVNCGHDAVKAVSQNSKVIVHLSNGYDNNLYRWMFDGLTNNGAKFDIIGMSLYPTERDWQTLNNQCLSNMSDMKSRYGKDVMICEVGMDYTQEVAAKNFISDIVNKTQSIGGLGVFYWEPQAYPNYNAGYRKGAWNSDGRPTLALEGFGYNENIPTPPGEGNGTVNSTSQNKYGDLNGDGKINTIDYSILNRYILEVIDSFPIQDGLKKADVNGDGKVNSADAVFMGRYLLEIIDKFPVEENSDPHPDRQSIKNLNVYETENKNNWRIMNNLSVGQKAFGDREYTISYVPQELVGADWIQPAMNSRSNTSLNNYASFEVETDGYVFIAHSDRVLVKPYWLSEYEKSSLTIKVRESDTVERTMTVYYKKVSAGEKVNLGINSNDGTTTSLIYLATATGNIALPSPPPPPPTPEPGSGRQMEYLDRGLVAVKTDNGVFVSWRLFGTDPQNIAFNIYRDGTKINSTPITLSTNYLDNSGGSNSKYYICPIIDGREMEKSKTVSVWNQNYLEIPLNRPSGGSVGGSSYTYSPNDISVGDLDGDGEYELVLKWEPSNAKDNSQAGHTGNVIIDAYKLNGTQLWRIDLGRNIRAGAHYTQFLVYDFDGDGRAEVVMKTADGTRDGRGGVIGNPNADYRNGEGFVLDGPEYLTVFDGLTGAALETINYIPPRGRVTDWGDNYGNRCDRFLATVAYLDGERPSIVMCRGYYTRTVLTAFNWRDGRLTHVWTFDSNTAGSGYTGQGNHNLSVGDVDGDGCDEIIYGAMAVDHDGRGLYTTRWGHGDAGHLSDLIPDRPGLEYYQIHENPPQYAATVRDARTGQLIFSIGTGDTGRGLAANIDPRHIGYQFWSSTSGGLYNSRGQRITTATPSSTNFAIWWDGDLLRELLDSNRIDKWDWNSNRTNNIFTAVGCSSNNGTKSTPGLSADILGDWREEVIFRTNNDNALRIYTTTHLTDRRIYTLMHDPIYRLSIAWQNVAYNQPPHPGFYLGHGMDTPPVPEIYLVKGN